MGARFRSWWQQIKKHRVAIVVTTAIIVVAVTLIIVGYWFDVTGFNGYTQVSIIRTLSGPTADTITRTEAYQPGKTLWDWLQLLIIPAVLAVGGYVINLTISRGEQEATKQRAKTEQEIASDNQRERALQDYIDKMSELLLDKDHPLRESAPEDEVRKIARVRTLTTLPRLDKMRKSSVLQFLYESGLIEKDKQIIDLSGADLSEADLRGANLRQANLSKAKLTRANLSFAKLTRADLRGAVLSSAKLTVTDLTRANLNDVNLYEADLKLTILGGADLSGAFNTTPEQLKRAKSLTGATMPDGSIHP